MNLRTLGGIVAIVVLVAGLSTPALAQERTKGDLALMYSALNDREMDETFTKGFVASAAVYIAPWLGVVGEVGGHYKTVTESSVDVDEKFESVMGGIRLGNLGGRSRFFVQALAGGTRAGATISGKSASVTQKYFSIQPGVGIDIAISGAVGIRLQADYRAVQDGSDWYYQARGAAGLVFSFGGR